jgi:hypothetical protein
VSLFTVTPIATKTHFDGGKLFPSIKTTTKRGVLGSVSKHVVAPLRDEIFYVSERRSYVKMSLETEPSPR